MNIKDIDFNKDYYGVLGVSKDASENDIKTAFRKKSLEYHPDRHTDDSEEDRKAAEEKFVEVNEAYSILSDKNLKKAYDNGPQDPIFNRFGGFGEWPQQEMHQAGSPVLIQLNVSWEDVIHGIKDRSVDYYRLVRCKECHGAGGKNIKECPHCHGTGQIISESKTAYGFYRQITPCPYCNGTGKTVGESCTKCHGTGLTKVLETFNVTANTEHLIHNGERLYVGRYGNESKDELGQNGELYVQVNHNWPENKEIVLTNCGWNNSGWSVVEQVDIPYYDIILGTKLTVNTPTGKKLSVNVPECSESGKQLRLRGQGFDIEGFSKGDYIIILNPKFPNKLGNKEKELLTEISKIKTAN